jgi:hypothetical protein
MLYCSLGLSCDDITVRGLLKFNHDLEGVWKSQQQFLSEGIEIGQKTFFISVASKFKVNHCLMNLSFPQLLHNRDIHLLSLLANIVPNIKVIKNSACVFIP